MFFKKLDRIISLLETLTCHARSDSEALNRLANCVEYDERDDKWKIKTKRQVTRKR